MLIIWTRGDKPQGSVWGRDPKEAALAIQYLQPRVILPLHWGTFPPLTGTPQELATLVNDPERIALVAPGEMLRA